MGSNPSSMKRKTGNKWSTKECARCGDPHTGYSGKLDANKVEYVVCKCTNKRMNVSGYGLEGHTSLFPTDWTKDDHPLTRV